MRVTDSRRRFAALALLPLLLLVGLLAAGCGSDDDGDAGESTSQESESAESDDATEEATEDEASEDATDEGTEDSDEETEGGDLSAEDAAVCDPYLEMVQGLEELDYTGKPDAVAAEMGPIMKTWAAQVPDLEQPSSMEDGAWDGLQTLAARVNELPDEPTNADITAVEEGLSAQEQADVDAAGKWFQTTCAPV